MSRPPVVEGSLQAAGFGRTVFPRKESIVPVFQQLMSLSLRLGGTIEWRSSFSQVRKGFGLKTAMSGRVETSSSDMSQDYLTWIHITSGQNQSQGHRGNENNNWTPMDVFVWWGWGRNSAMSQVIDLDHTKFKHRKWKFWESHYAITPRYNVLPKDKGLVNSSQLQLHYIVARVTCPNN